MTEERKIIFEISRDKVRGLADDQRITDRNGLMYPAYRAALGGLRTILRGTKEWDALSERKNIRNDHGNAAPSLYGFSGNVIAFCAERGQGKTSAMLSFSRALDQCNTPEESEDWSQWEDIHTGKHYYSLPPIDPTMLNDGESVTQLFLARLFHKIQKIWEASSDFCGMFPAAREEKKLDILEKFQQCRQCLNAKDAFETDEFGHFLRTGSIFELKEHICSILRSFFELKGKAPENSYIIIQLDDTDMQLENAFNTLEEVRKHLSVPHVIILMATNLRQLQYLVAQHYIDELKLSKNCFLEMFEERDISHMAAKYIDKLIPASQAIHLPTIQLHWESNRSVYLKVKDSQQREADLETELFALAFQKTGLVFMKHSTYLHNILPSTLRGLTHFYHFLHEMQDPNALLPSAAAIDPTEMDEAYCRKLIDVSQAYLVNLSLFESYFLNDWCASRLTLSGQKIIREMNEAYVSQRMWRAVELLYKPEIVPQDLGKSYFGFLAALQRRKRNPGEISDLRLYYAIHLYMSIQFHKRMRTEQIACLEERIQAIRESSVALEKAFAFEYDRLYESYQLSDADSELYPEYLSDLSEWRDKYISYLEKLEREEGELSIESEEFQNLMLWLMRLFRLDVQEAVGSRGNLKSVQGLQNYALYVLVNWDVQEAIAGETFARSDAPDNIDPLHALLRRKDAEGLPERSIREFLDDIVFPNLPGDSAVDRAKLDELLKTATALREHMDEIVEGAYSSQFFAPLYSRCGKLLRDAVPDAETRAPIQRKLDNARSAYYLTIAKGQMTQMIRLIQAMLSKNK